MAQKNKVIHSINQDGALLCVDIFQRPDGTFGFDEYRRDPEDGRGWFSIGMHSGLLFESAASALAEARKRVVWLDDALD